MTITAAPELIATTAESLSHLPTFDPKTFADLVTIRGAAQSEIGWWWQVQARKNMNKTEALFEQVKQCLRTDSYAAQALLEEAQIHTAAATLCVRAGAQHEAEYADVMREQARQN